MLACDSELKASYHMLGGMKNGRVLSDPVVWVAQICPRLTGRFATRHAADIILHGVDKRLLAWQLSFRVMSGILVAAKVERHGRCEWTSTSIDHAAFPAPSVRVRPDMRSLGVIPNHEYNGIA